MIEADGKYASREGLLSVSVLPQRDAEQAILCSLPRISEAMRLRDGVVALMGDRRASPGHRGDVVSGPPESVHHPGVPVDVARLPGVG
jgi:hypothetical protein